MSSQPKYITESKKYHIVKKGDTLNSISNKYGISKNKLKLYNNLKTDEIFIGQKVYLIPNLAQRHEFITKRPIPKSGIHIVKDGEDVFTIMKMYEVDIVDLIDMNSLQDFDLIAGEKIILKADAKQKVQKQKTAPKKETPEFHIIRYGDNLYQISQKYNISISELKSINNLKSDNIIAGRKLYLVPQKSNNIAKQQTSVSIKKQSTEKKTQTKSSSRNVSPKISHSTKKLILPVKGNVTSEFGMRNNRPHKGIDIAGKIGSPIHAVLDGEVAYTGKQKGYGYVVILKHANDIMTIYAHNNANLVRKGAKVKQGQPIATLGNSGRSTGPHLHFEYRIDGKAINPRKVLPEL